MNHKKTILLVEDEQETLQAMLKALIKRRPELYKPLIAIDGYEALDFMINKEIDLVVLDLHMSNFNGLELCQHVAKDEDLRKIPILISSGFADDSMQEQLRMLGVEHFLRKPYKIEDLISKIDELMMCPA